MNLNISSLGRFVWKSQAIAGCNYQQVRNKWANWMMIRDVKRRRLNAEHFLERTRINALRKNDVLPVEIREMADKDVNKFDLNACPLRINNRCVTRGIVKEWRMSRIVWRHLADYNKLSGVQRAMWDKEQ
ncbi:hypothetical protein MSG28_015823 [Choristoneura fumiferana]|uniref:Uncharacterized protein n=1 Tax=Choristoneura fumiferana TaxID=7141 RepID=A0ACC0KCG6_CHOFU|nr:hypothetical protein MSG28_015823 [Choristoneura fumiferana]